MTSPTPTLDGEGVTEVRRMKPSNTKWWLRITMIILPLLFLGGCIDYTIETTSTEDETRQRTRDLYRKLQADKEEKI